MSTVCMPGTLFQFFQFWLVDVQCPVIKYTFEPTEIQVPVRNSMGQPIAACSNINAMNKGSFQKPQPGGGTPPFPLTFFR